MRRHRVVSSVTGEYKVCARCGRDTDVVLKPFRQILSCALVRYDWLCGKCWDAHRAACDICLSAA